MLYKTYDHNEQYVDRYEKTPIRIYLFCHDDIDESDRCFIYRDYLRDLMFEMEQVFARNIIIELHYAIPGLTDMTYQLGLGQEQHAGEEFVRQAHAFIHEQDLSYERTYRYGLITRENLSSEVGGVGLERQHFFIASLAGYQHIAHELGHTFNARHEDAEVSFGVPPSQTYMRERDNPFYVNDYRFSDANRRRMAEFLSSVD